jgi:hypothetical protein
MSGLFFSAGPTLGNRPPAKTRTRHPELSGNGSPTAAKERRPPEVYRVGMLFYQFIVTRGEVVWPQNGTLTVARVMLRMDTDVETSTREAVRYLEGRGWSITGVRHAQQADSAEEFAIDDAVMHLYDEAAGRGLACEFRQIEEHALVAS